MRHDPQLVEQLLEACPERRRDARRAGLGAAAALAAAAVAFALVPGRFLLSLVVPS